VKPPSLFEMQQAIQLNQQQKKKMAKNEEDNQKTSMYIHHPGIESSSTAVLFAPNH